MIDSSPTILLVEDEDLIAKLYKYNLEKGGFRVEVAKDGLEAYEMLKRKSYPLMLLDLMLPKLNGIELLKKVRGENIALEMPVIALTNVAQEHIIKEVYALKAVKYLIKANYTPTQVVQEVRNFIKQTSKKE